MPIPIILSALVTAYGSKKGYDGYKKHSVADEIVNSAKRRYEETKTSFDSQQKATHDVLDVLYQNELKIGQQLNEFKTLADDLLQKLNSGRQDKLEISIPKHALQKIEGYSYSAIGVIGAAAGYGVVSVATAALAPVLAVCNPTIAIAGWIYNSHGEEAVRASHKINSEVGSAIAKLKETQKQLRNVEDYALSIIEMLKAVYAQFDQYFDILKAVVSQIESAKVLKLNPQAAMAQLSDTFMHAVGNGFALATILVDLITTPLFQVKLANGDIVKDENGVPVIDTDEDGLMILNTAQLDSQLNIAKTSAALIEPV